MKKECVLCGNTFEGHGSRKYCFDCVPYKSGESGYASSIKRAMKKRAIELRGGRCERCGYDKCIAALEFHHRNPEEKSFRLGDGYNHCWEDFLKEVDKCELLCANCHAEEHYSQVYN